jgi:hypothetical protein
MQQLLQMVVLPFQIQGWWHPSVNQCCQLAKPGLSYQFVEFFRCELVQHTTCLLVQLLQHQVHCHHLLCIVIFNFSYKKQRKIMTNMFHLLTHVFKTFIQTIKSSHRIPGSTCSGSNIKLLCTTQHKSVIMRVHHGWYRNVLIMNTHYI